MKRFIIMLFMVTLLTACTGATTNPETDTAIAVPVETASTLPESPNNATDLPSEPESNVDILANLPAASCESGLTPENQEGPYFKAGSPEVSNLFTEGMQGTRLILVGQVLSEECLPIPHVKLDFWQADAEGNYDNEGYVLRGYQFSDNKGRYYLETVLPGLYSSRPIEHIHVKVVAPNGNILVTQLYFPQQPVDGLTVTLDDRGEYILGYFDFVIQVSEK